MTKKRSNFTPTEIEGRIDSPERERFHRLVFGHSANETRIQVKRGIDSGIYLVLVYVQITV